MDKAGEGYWETVWEKQSKINKVDTNYYTNKLLHELYSKYFPHDNSKEICEIGCAMSQNLLYFNDYFGYRINGFDYEVQSAIRTREIYEKMEYKANIFYADFFDKNDTVKYDILSSFAVFEHFDNLNRSIEQTKLYVKDSGMILTVIPNMNGIVGFLQKIFNKKVYDIHIPYTKNNILMAHEKNSYKTLFCDYYDLYQSGVVNINGIKNENKIKKLLALPGKIFYFLNKILNVRLDSKFYSPYIIYIGIKD